MHTASADTYRTFFFPTDAVEQLQPMHPNGASHTTTRQKYKLLAHHLLPDQTFRTTATIVDRNPFETTLTSQPICYLPCRALGELAML